jgi:hypothetical protein
VTKLVALQVLAPELPFSLSSEEEIVMRNALVFAVLALLAVGSGLYAQPPQSLTMTNATVVSVDPSQRIMVIKNTEGRQQTVELDDQLAGFAGIRAGDQIVLSLRKGPGRDRVMAIEKAGPTTKVSTTTTTTTTAEGTSGTATSSAAPIATRETHVTTSTQTQDTRVVTPSTDAAVELRAEAALGTYSDRVATFAQQATELDRLWGEAVRVCNASVDAHYDAREWVSLWDKQVRLDTSTGACRELLNQVISAGETINAGMAAAQQSATKAGASAGELRAIRQRYAMDWDGWGRPAPDRFNQP